MSQQKHIILQNGSCCKVNEIPLLTYNQFTTHTLELMTNPQCHCVNYYSYPVNENAHRFICCIANDSKAEIYVYGWECLLKETPKVYSITPACPALHIFEREISENTGLIFENHPWNKPVRWSFDRQDATKVSDNYPFYRIESEELHQVGVGPIHAGIIEPGHFRFICNGEKVLHLEIHLGYQHRGVEQLFLQKETLAQQTILAESIAGDTVAAHTTAFAHALESLAGTEVSQNTIHSRTLAIELERVAIHTGDLSALCTDIAYQPGAAVFQGLRTTLINTFLTWCGNRFARRLIRAGANPFPLNIEIKEIILKNLLAFESRYIEMAEYMFDAPGVLARFEDTGIVTEEQARLIGAVGMAARTCDIRRDIRSSHPYGWFLKKAHHPVCHHSGDVYARAILRHNEVKQSLSYIRKMLEDLPEEDAIPNKAELAFTPDSFTISMTEGWRGEICHCAITDSSGKLKHYKIKDPSLHNWFALALAVRNNDISDFPICNKSFDLSYCGYDL
ncbi:MAG: NADH-quinone oxidoreductase subunit C [Bacteroidota bacterium]